jgi:hypothetical protein
MKTQSLDATKHLAGPEHNREVALAVAMMVLVKRAGGKIHLTAAELDLDKDNVALALEFEMGPDGYITMELVDGHKDH